MNDSLEPNVSDTLHNFKTTIIRSLIKFSSYPVLPLESLFIQEQLGNSFNVLTIHFNNKNR